MEHESFEDSDVAHVLNENFVCIKVDREVRPDLDDAYMAVVQAVSGRGGWPMSTFLTPNLKPIYGGTYWPKDDRGGHAGFLSLLKFFANAWDQRQGEIEVQANELSSLIRERREQSIETNTCELNREILARGRIAVLGEFDLVYGGIESRPKFPPHTALQFMFEFGSPQAVEFCQVTLDKMAMGGIHDWVGGGFHRYSTDEKWILPHFEKMLYDNALLLTAFGRAGMEKVATGIGEWLQREMLGLDGLYFSALDADSDGEEGLFYTWTYDEIRTFVSPLFLEEFEVRPEGNYKDEATGQYTGRNILYCKELPTYDVRPELNRLLVEREKRKRPFRDEKCLLAWNGLLLSGFVGAGMEERAIALAESILKWKPIPHQVMNGVPTGAGFADLGFVVQGLLDLANATVETQWREEAERLFLDLAKRFRDPKGGWFLSENEDAVGLGRTKPWQDSPMPSVNGVLARCASRLGYSEWAKEDLCSMIGWMEKFPQATEMLHLALSDYLERNTVQFRVNKIEHLENEQLKVQLCMSIPTGFHVLGIGEETGEGLATELLPEGFKIVGVSHDSITPEWAGNVNIELFVKFESSNAFLEVRYQVCTDSECLLPVTVRIDLRRSGER